MARESTSLLEVYVKWVLIRSTKKKAEVHIIFLVFVCDFAYVDKTIGDFKSFIPALHYPTT